ncbi:MAG: glycosyltransferase family 39 protein [Anaerolineae bacterium]
MQLPSNLMRLHSVVVTTILAVLALGFAIWGQRYLTDRGVPLDGPLLYLIAIVLFVVALRRNPLRVFTGEPRAMVVPSVTSIVVARWRRWLLVAAAITGVLGFVTFGTDTFTVVNVSLWLASIVTFVVATWDWGAESGTVVWERIRAWRTPLTWVGIALIGIIVLAAFFRYYELASVPLDPTSDHAEKLLDVYDVLNGQRPTFFVRNTGREWFQFYYTSVLISLFNLSTTFVTLKIGTATAGLLTIPLVFLLAREVGGTGMGLLTALLMAMSKWHTAISRAGLRFPFTALFTAPTIFFVYRGLRLNRRNDWLLAGLVLGLGLQTYTSMRMVPLLVALLVILRLLWDLASVPGGFRAGFSLAIARLRRRPPAEDEPQVDVPALTRSFWVNVLFMTVATILVFLPTLRYSIDHPEFFWFRSLTRATTLESGQAFNPLANLMTNIWSAMLQFNYRGDVVWVNTVMWDPQLDPITGALFVLGIVYVVLAIIGLVCFRNRCLGVFKERSFTAAAVLLSLCVMMLPAILALAYPIEVPSVSRGGGIIPFAMIIASIPLIIVIRELRGSFPRWGTMLATVLVGSLMLAAVALNFRSYFVLFDQQTRVMVGNSTEMATVLRGFVDSVGDFDHAYMVAYPNWVDTRNAYFTAGAIPRNNFIMTDQLAQTAPTQVNDPAPKLYLLNRQDQKGAQTLQQLYPEGRLSTYPAQEPSQDFFIFFVPAATPKR